LTIIEALQYGLPAFSHTAAANGHIETIGNAGKVVDTIEQYFNEIENVFLDGKKMGILQKNAAERYKNHFWYKTCVSKYEEMIKNVVEKSNRNEYSFSVIKSTDSWLEEWANE